MEKEELLKKRIQDLCRVAYQRDIVTFTDFLDLNEQHIVNSLPMHEQGVSLKLFGGYEMSERQIAAFLPDALSYDWAYPICCLKIMPVDSRFSKQPGHRDYLGALLNLGIQRSMLGDLILDETGAYLFCVERMADFIIQELSRVRHATVHTTIMTEGLPEVAKHYQEITGTVSSVRLDSVISTAFSTSRSSITGLIEGGKVFVNGRCVTSNGYNVKDGDIISVRGMGKFQFMETISRTKKGRNLIRINRYT